MPPATLLTPPLPARVHAAVDALSRGLPILLYDSDGREAETDLVWASQHVTAAAVARLRRDAGGLLCTTLAPSVHRALGLPWLADVLRQAARDHPVLSRLTRADVPYEDAENQKPSFGLTINHRDTFTGVTDHDRARTIRRLAEIAAQVGRRPEAELAKTFAAEFKTPGHVILLNAHPRLLEGRAGHTELATALMALAGLAPTATICEMLGGPDGAALPKADAVKYAASNGLVFLTGNEVLDAWSRPSARPAPNGHAFA